MKKLISVILSIAILVSFRPIAAPAPSETEHYDNIKTVYAKELSSTEPVSKYVVLPEPKQEPKVSDEEIELLALVTMAEAEGESEEGKRMVIDTVLNRVDSDRFPGSIREVVYQKNQFTSMWNGRSERCVVTDEVRQLVKEELNKRTNNEALYFRTKHYHNFGTPLMKVGNHYFSGC